MPHDASLDIVGNLSAFAIHMLKASFGTAPLNHTTSNQSFASCLGLITSHVAAELKTFKEESPAIQI